MTKKAFCTLLVCGLLLSGCASTDSDSSSSNSNNTNEKVKSADDCAASGQKSYEMASGSIICY